MRTNTESFRLLLILSIGKALILLLFLCLQTAELSAQGKGKGGGGKGGGGGGDDGGGDPPAVAVEPGTFYYRHEVSYGWRVDSMRSAGGGLDPINTLFDQHLAISSEAEPSLREHGGQVYFLQTEDVDGELELFALGKDGQFKTQLTFSNDDLIILPTAAGASGLRWSQMDQMVAFTGARVDAANHVIESGVFTAPILFDPLGNLIGLTESPTLAYSFAYNAANDRIDIESFDLTADGSTIVWAGPDGGLWGADSNLDTSWQITEDGFEPSIAPNGSTVAFNASDNNAGKIDIIEITDDVSNQLTRETIARFSNGRKNTNESIGPCWSPFGSQLLFTNINSTNRDSTSSIYRVNNDGSTLTQVADYNNANRVAMGWRMSAVDALFSLNLTNELFGPFDWDRDEGSSILVQPDGKIVVCGNIKKDPYQASSDVFVLRLNDDFTRDTTFGVNGVVLIDFGPETRDFGQQVRLQDDGKLLVCGSSYDYTFSSSAAQGIAARLASDGTVEATYAGPPRGGWGFVDIVQQADGKYVTFTNAPAVGEKNDLILVRLNPDLTLDTSFGINGEVVYAPDGDIGNSGWGFAQRSDDSLLVTGIRSGVGCVALFDPDGVLLAERLLPTSVLDKNRLQTIVVDEFDNAYIGGKSNVAEYETGEDNEMIILKLNADLNYDVSFADQGIFQFNTTTASEVTQDDCSSLRLDSIGRIYASGAGGYRLRLTPDGELDPLFAEYGLTRLPSEFEGGAIAVDTQDRLVTCGTNNETSTSSNGRDTAIGRLNQ